MAELHERTDVENEGTPKETSRNYWVVRWKLPNGRTSQKTFKSWGKNKVTAPKKKAEAFQAQKRVEEARNKGQEEPHIGLLKQEKHTFREVAKEWLKSREDLERERATMDDYRAALKNHVLPWLDAHGLSDVRFISVHHVRAFRDALATNQIRSYKETIDGKPMKRSEDGKLLDESAVGKKLGIVAKRKLLKTLKTVLRFAVGRGYIQGVPGDDIHLETPTPDRNRAAVAKQTAVFQPDQVRALLRAADDLAAHSDGRTRKSWNQGGYRAIVYLTCYTGARISEVLGLTFEHLDLDHGLYTVLQSVKRHRDVGSAKSPMANRPIDIHPVAIAVLKEYLEKAGLTDAAPSAYVFSTASGKPHLPSNIHTRLWQPLLKRANELAKDPQRKGEKLKAITQKGVAFHGLRRWLNSWLVHMGVERQQVRAMLGHETEDVNKLYQFHLDSLTPPHIVDTSHILVTKIAAE